MFTSSALSWTRGPPPSVPALVSEVPWLRWMEWMRLRSFYLSSQPRELSDWVWGSRGLSSFTSSLDFQTNSRWRLPWPVTWRRWRPRGVEAAPTPTSILLMKVLRPTKTWTSAALNTTQRFYRGPLPYLPPGQTESRTSSGSSSQYADNLGVEHATSVARHLL